MAIEALLPGCVRYLFPAHPTDLRFSRGTDIDSFKCVFSFFPPTVVGRLVTAILIMQLKFSSIKMLSSFYVFVSRHAGISCVWNSHS